MNKSGSCNNDNSINVNTSLLGISFGTPLFLIGIIGNSLIPLSVWKKRHLRTIPNYFLVNLAISDLIALVFSTFPLLLETVTLNNGAAADMLCKFFFSYHIPGTASLASIFTVTVMSIERYNAVLKPLQQGFRLQKENFCLGVLLIWLCGIVASLPWYILSRYKQRKNVCDHGHYKDVKALPIFSVVLTLFSIIVPSIMITFCYFKIVRKLYFNRNKTETELGVSQTAAKRRLQQTKGTVKFSMIITLVFISCTFPLGITHCFKILAEGHSRRKYYKYSAFIFLAMACFNPLIHCYFSSQFRQAFREIFRFQWRKKQPQQQLEQQQQQQQQKDDNRSESRQTKRACNKILTA